MKTLQEIRIAEKLEALRFAIDRNKAITKLEKENQERLLEKRNRHTMRFEKAKQRETETKTETESPLMDVVKWVATYNHHIVSYYNNS